MPWFDMPEEQLRSYRTATIEPEGLDAWWAQRLEETRAAARETTLTPYKPELYAPTEVFDVEFSGGRGDRIRGWYVRPVGAGDAPVPVLVEFVGYGGGRGVPADHLGWAAMGIGLLVMDTRGQGGFWGLGATPDGLGTTAERAQVMTRGIERPEDYYYTRVYCDAVRAVEVAAQLPGADASRIGVTGGSQGGGLALAAAALAAGVRVCAADVPFLCDFARAITTGGDFPYQEIAEFLSLHYDLVDAVFETLRYVDNALLATRITAPTFVTVGLMDVTCPPSTVFAAYNAIPGTKSISVNPFGQHAQSRQHEEEKIQYVRTHLLGQAG